MVSILRDLGHGHYGGFFTVAATRVSGSLYAGEGYALVADDYSWCNCNGDANYEVIAVGDSPEELCVWAATNGFEVGARPPGFPDRVVVG